MSKNTFFNTRFWQDFFISDLDPSEKLLFIYCLTCPYLSLTGIYELPLKHMALETGLDKEMVIKILARFEEKKKIIYVDGWLCVVNYPKYQTYKGGKLQVAIEREIKAIPKDILNKFIGYGYPMDTLSILPLDRDRDKDKELDKEREGKKETKPRDFSYSSSFEEFWNEYPKKVGKGGAYTAYQKVKPPSNEILIPLLKKQKTNPRWKEENGRFIPNPQTWLNQRRWEDEVQETKETVWKM